MAEHYDTAVIPARVKHPKDKSITEGSVKYASTWIIAALRNQNFFSLDEVQRAFVSKLEELNHYPFKKREGNRHSAYYNEEQAFMKPLPMLPYEWLIRTLKPNEAYDLLEIVESRCTNEKGSMIFCTQHKVEGWYDRINPDPDNDSPISEAIMDRIIHNSYNVTIYGDISMGERRGLKHQTKVGDNHG